MRRSAGFAVVALASVLYWLANRQFDAGRGDFFYLAEAFLNGRTWLTFQPGPNDVIVEAGRYYVPFAPFPAMALMPLVAIVGAVTADQLESGINAALAGASVGMCWWLLGRIGVASLRDRLWLAVLFGFSTQILWITTRGGVWHTGQLIATILTFGCLIELWGARRAWVVGLLAGAAFLTRAPLAFAMPLYALLLWPEGGRAGAAIRAGAADRARAAVRSVLAAIPWRSWVALTAAFLPAIVFFFAYNAIRFGSPLESGYALATLPDWLERQRAVGLFSLAHVPMNIDLLVLHVPALMAAPPYFKPDGLGMSVFITSPGLLFALRADWRDRRSWWLAGATVAVLIPTLLYYGGGWLQYGYRYFLDSVPFVMALCGLAAVHRGGIGTRWRALIVAGTVVMAGGVYWAYNL